ncbi:MAG: DUF4214 domain-containing protein [Pyrinomonadaceae bacterium]
MALQYANPVRRTLLLVAEQSVFVVTSPLDGYLNSVGFRSGVNAQVQDAIFDVKINGVSIYEEESDRSTMAVGTKKVDQLITPVAVARGDTVTVDLVQVHASGIGNPFTALLGFDDRVTKSKMVRDLYFNAFHREPTSTELTDGAAALATPCAAFDAAGTINAFKTLADSVFTDSEYTSQGTSNTQFLKDLYLAVLGRVFDSDGLAYWLTQMTGGQTRAQMRAAFVYSTEFLNYRMSQACAAVAPAADATSLNGIPLPASLPADAQILKYDDATSRYIFADESVGTSIPAGDLNTATNVLEKLQGVTIELPVDVEGIKDDFNDNNLSPNWTKTGGSVGFTNVYERNGRIELEVSDNNYSQIDWTGTLFDFTNTYLLITWLKAHASNSAEVYYSMMKNTGAAGGYFGFYKNSGNVTFQHGKTGQTTLTHTVAYSATDHKFVRIRHDAATGHVFIETMPDDGSGQPDESAVTVQLDIASPYCDMTNMSVQMAAGTGSGPVTPDTFQFEDMKTGVGALVGLVDGADYKLVYHAGANKFTITQI